MRWGEKWQRKTEFSTNTALGEEIILGLEQVQLAQWPTYELVLLPYSSLGRLRDGVQLSRRARV